jgi:hypothetical protein
MAIMAPAGDNCPTGIVTDDGKCHAKLACARAPGNTDRDVDPSTVAPLSAGQPRLVAN